MITDSGQALPWVSVVCDEPTTIPPWLLLSPMTMNGRIYASVFLSGESSRIRPCVTALASNKAQHSFVSVQLAHALHQLGRHPREVLVFQCLKGLSLLGVF